ncbi:MAG TPA: leucine--tRNA ligase, partial [Candidatus Aenigmarchaeota archaeon]|nr:leucine--tRNA ligase [Candidatus Aenigmarchaeota archaeon]
FMDFREIERKWQEKWREARLFEADVRPEKKKFYLTVAYPYPSGGMHIGHLRTYTVPDVIARFKRMQGFNVLFPMAWHVTGTPIIGALKRLKAREKKQMFVLKEVYRISEKELSEINEPMDYARYFIEKHYKRGMNDIGFSIDWRREFTTNDPHYNRFIEWQYSVLKSRKFVKKGLHPVKWCLLDKNPVTTHDLLEGEGAEIHEFVLIKFSLDGKILPAATLRPETVFGVTNIWVNPESNLVEARVDDEEWIVSEECAEKLSHQNRNVKIIRKFRGSELIGKEARNPVLKNKVLILPASFVDPDNATGIVMSVPSHAPFDYIALRDLRENEKELKKWDLRGIEKIEPITLIDTEGLPANPGVTLVEEAGIKNQREKEKIEALTKEVYKKEFHKGVLNKNCGKYAGKRVSQAKEILVRDFKKQGIFDEMLEFSERVVCRCGGKVIVAKKDSWFLDYGNEEWKKRALSLLKRMKIIPEYMRSEYESTIEWLEDWPCIRNFGLGTRLPWDERFIIDPLSDSTIYMSYYTISHLIKKHNPERLIPELFDYIYLGKGRIDSVSERSGIPKDEIREMRKSFEYWYPLDWRCSAHELVQNHLTFFIFHHTAIFPEDMWPRGIASWGVGLLEGGKMSSSKGNVILAHDAIKKYGADVTRFFLMTSSEPWQDFDWKAKEVENYRKRIINFYNRVISMSKESKERDYSLID